MADYIGFQYLKTKGTVKLELEVRGDQLDELMTKMGTPHPDEQIQVAVIRINKTNT